jgi:hypothetical protein
MAKSDQTRDEIRKKHWLRALQLAKLLFEEEGYFIDYLIETEELVKDMYQGREGLAVQTRMHWNFTKPSKDQS